MPIWSRCSLLALRTKAMFLLSGDQTTSSCWSMPALPASSISVFSRVFRSSSQKRPFLSVWPSQCPSGDGYSAQRWLLPSFVNCSPWPEPSLA